MIFGLETKTQPISKEQVWESWKRIKKGGEGVGVDNVSIAMIEKNPRKYLYPLWNRLSSGSYFPPPVREARIPKGDGKQRSLGIPTMIDRVAQDVIRAELEKIVEPDFHPSSFGYRSGRRPRLGLIKLIAQSAAIPISRIRISSTFPGRAPRTAIGPTSK